MSNYFLWGGLTLHVAFPGLPGVAGLTFGGLIMTIGFVMMLLGK